VLPSDCNGVESRKTFVSYIRRGGQKVKALVILFCLFFDQIGKVLEKGQIGLRVIETGERVSRI
jgi:hypothetical protein